MWLNSLRQHNSQARIQGVGPRGPCPPPLQNPGSAYACSIFLAICNLFHNRTTYLEVSSHHVVYPCDPTDSFDQFGVRYTLGCKHVPTSVVKVGEHVLVLLYDWPAGSHKNPSTDNSASVSDVVRVVGEAMLGQKVTQRSLIWPATPCEDLLENTSPKSRS